MAANASAGQLTDMDAGAASDDARAWHQIDWGKVEREVRRLQARIVKARQEGRWGKVKVLQRLLTHSFSGKAYAVRRVTENQGKKTPGVDGETWSTPAKKMAAMAGLRHRGYHPQPLRRVHIPKSNGKLRPLSISTMRDRAMQVLHLLALDPLAECQADPNSYGFRRERSCADAIGACFTALRLKTSAEWVLEGDIKSCFDRISHAWLLANIPMDKALLRAWLKAGYLEKDALHPTENGTPQGGPISPVLANMALDGLETLLRERFPTQLRPHPKVNFVRYADDFVVTGATRDLLEAEVKPLIAAFLAERGLELSAEKTVVTHVEDGFDFLGQNVRKYRCGKQIKLLITPAQESIRGLLRKVKDVLRRNRQAKAGNVVLQLNPIIAGWARYHQHVVSSETFSSVDHAIFAMLRRWTRRRHPNKSRTWIRKKYFVTVGSRNWVFAGEVTGKNGTKRMAHLVTAADTPIVRHAKVKGVANPYDPAWELYFEDRLGVHMAQTLRGRRQLLHLWKAQRGLCPVCNQKITRLTGWHNHHRVWRSNGGGDTAENRMLVHPTCHRRLHALSLTVVRPRAAHPARS